MPVLSIQAIRRDFQPREYYDEEKILEFAEAMRRGELFPPVVVYYDGENYWLADGFHRVEAVLLVERGEIDAEIVLGTYSDLCAEHERMVRAIREDLRASAAKNPNRS